MAHKKTGNGTVISYGLGSIAYGIKDNGFHTFLMIYFNQVLGLPAYLVGISLLIAMSFDAVTDPWMGYLSDRCTSRMGRRHPFMYLSILPIALTYYFLWNPPELSNFALFVYLTVMAIAVRLAITVFEVPNSALIGEITYDYDKRTAISGLRFMFGWLGGVVMSVVVYTAFLPDSAEYTPGILNPQGYKDYGLFASMVMVFFMLVSSLGTHRAASKFTEPDKSSSGFEFKFVHNLKHIIANPSFRSVFFAVLLINLALGIMLTLQPFFGIYYFDLTTVQLSIIALTLVPAVIIAYLSSAYIIRGYEKRAVAILSTWLVMTLSIFPVLAKYFDVLPPSHSPELFYILAVNAFATTALSVLIGAVTFSMIVDLVDADQKETGLRSEGLYLAAFSFSRKIVTGFGIFVSGIMLSLGARSGNLDNDTMRMVVLPYVVLLIVAYFLSIMFLRRYGLTRLGHNANLKAIGK